jgi:hypothetical protein
MALPLDRDPLSGAVETFDFDEADDLCIIKRHCDVQPVVDLNRSFHLYGDGWVGRGRDMRLAARIPLDVVLLWKQRYGVDVLKSEHWPQVKRLLEDPEWRYLRPTSFRL